MRSTLLTTLFAVFLLSAPRAEAQTPPPPPTPFDAFAVNLLITDWKARLDNFAVALQNEPSSHGYIVAYGARYRLPGWPLRRAHAARHYLTDSRGLSADRISVFAGDERAEPGFELWMVRAGESLPVKPLDYALALSGERAPVKFDEHFIYDEQLSADDPDNPGEGVAVGGAYVSRYEPLSEYLKADPALRVCLITYARRRDPRHTDRRMAAREKRRLLSAFAVAPARVVARPGGRRRYQTVEVWLVPPGAPLPRPKPELRPARRRKR